ncbi:putative metal-dependent hydrolase [Flavobacterium sp. NG2]|uniref:YfiT family bacillithiol transferase n=1 Tax=Flavobacterium sp. NG2 TaxID=3097547 RepID=UPI002A82D26A|nr:putative metal-dependent hydrolase [Flavobacterium sp. NG2]WPR70309.1 putative metal-dependent hydrolase [Flavobacterium sp. NG2]
MNIEKLKYPIGKFTAPTNTTKEIVEEYILDIQAFPERLKKEIETLSEAQLDTVYRPGGWTIRQLVNHCADSHMNSLIRFKLALTEDKPTIKPYFEDRWAELIDSKNIDIKPALLILEGLHARWSLLLQSLSNEELKKTFIHPETNKEIRIDENIGIYAWHCNHHLAHIISLKSTMNWL